jgi:hypothetical protein
MFATMSLVMREYDDADGEQGVLRDCLEAAMAFVFAVADKTDPDSLEDMLQKLASAVKANVGVNMGEHGREAIVDSIVGRSIPEGEVALFQLLMKHAKGQKPDDPLDFTMLSGTPIIH